MTSSAKISNLDESNEILKFTLSNVNVSYANSIRRILLSNIPCIVFKTQSYEENNVDIMVNNTRLNNELLKQRISSIPIHVDDLEGFQVEDYIVELSKTNNTTNIIYASTEDFKIKNIKLNKYLETNEVRQLFPPDPITGDFIDIVRLRPKLNDSLEGESIVFNAKLTISTAEDDGTFNVVSTCAYGNTLDAIKIKEVWEIKEKELSNSHSKEEIEFMKKDWLLLDAKRIFLKDSFDFIIETIGIYSNFKLLELACAILIKKLYNSLESLKGNSDLIKDAPDTMENCYIITLENEDYSVGKILEYCLYQKYFEDKKDLTYVGFLKKHPHDTFSIIKIACKDINSKDDIIFMLEECVNYSVILINSIRTYFSNE